MKEDPFKVVFVAEWIYDHFSVEKKISGYPSDRYLSKEEFVQAVLKGYHGPLTDKRNPVTGCL